MRIPLHTLCVELAEQERRVLRLLMPNPRTSAPIVAAAGLTIDHFGQPDNRLAFAAWQVACERDLPTVTTLRVLRRALAAEGLWDPETPAGSSGMRHSDMTLARLATHRLSEEELDFAAGIGPDDGNPLARAVARHVVALVEAADLVREVAA